jgi:hypothetical protein
MVHRKREKMPLTLLTKNLGEELKLTLSLAQLGKLAKISRFFEDRLSEQAERDQDINIDFRKFEYDSLNYFLKWATSGKKTTLTSEMNAKEIEFLSDYLHVEFETISTERLFKLLPRDKMLRDEEMELRTKLYGNEETDFREDDNRFLFERVCFEMDYSLERDVAKPPLSVKDYPRSDDAQGPAFLVNEVPNGWAPPQPANPPQFPGFAAPPQFPQPQNPANPFGGFPGPAQPLQPAGLPAFPQVPAQPNLFWNPFGGFPQPQAAAQALQLAAAFPANPFGGIPQAPVHVQPAQEKKDEDGPFWGLFGKQKYCRVWYDGVHQAVYSNRDRRKIPVAPGSHSYCYKHLDKGEREKDPDPEYEIKPVPNTPYHRIGREKEMVAPKKRWQHIGSYLEELVGDKFSTFDYTNTVIAGGSIFTILTGNRGFEDSFKFINDVDFFIITKDQKEADATVARILEHFYVDDGNNMIMHTPHSITFDVPIVEHGVMFVIKVQVILRLYNSIAQIISGFDLDSSAVAWNGKHLYCMKRFVRMLQTSSNLVDPDRQSRTYSFRLSKYVRRGVGMTLPGYNPKRILKTSTLIQDPKGLAKVVRTYFNFLKSRRHAKDEIKKEIGAAEEDVVDEHDYDTTFPTADLNLESLIGWLHGFALSNGIHHENGNYIEAVKESDVRLPYRLVRNYEELVSGQKPNPEWGQGYGHDEIEEALFDEISDMEPGLKYRTKNPGTQSTASFFPTTEEWYDDLYVPQVNKERYEPRESKTRGIRKVAVEEEDDEEERKEDEVEPLD